jgi:prolyl-tRNA editing enzyme YbaK/EbsC (Cys-tRNA(Pro) deacylase)
MKVFISHSSRDKALVREVVGYFPPWLRTWVDENELLFGSSLRPSLEGAINSEVDYVVLIFGRDAAESDWVRQEIAWAKEHEERLARTFVLPVLVDDSRHRLTEVGLDGRTTLEIKDFTEGSTRLLSERLVNHIAGWMSETLERRAAEMTPDHEPSDSLDALGASAVSTIREIPAPWRAEIESMLVRPFVDAVSSARIGTIPLSPGLYYQRVLAEMSRADDRTRILAVSTLSSQLWSRDSDQARYAECNLEAVRRGTKIRRLFVLPETQALAYEDEILRQEGAGIETRVGSTSLLAHAPDLDDFVLFEKGDRTRAYIAHPSIDGSRRIRSGALLLSTPGLARKRDAFELAWDLAMSGPAFFETRRRVRDRKSRLPQPGARLAARYLDTPVVSCEEAATARGIPLAQELKTLLVRTDGGIVAVHIPGDSSLSLRKVKARLETTEAFLADPTDLSELGLSPGTVCAVLEPVWAMPHLVSRRVLTLKSVMTNNGTRTGYFEFEPGVLVEAADVTVGDFEKSIL